MQGVTEEGLAQLHQGMGTRGRNMGSTHNLAMLADAYGKTGQTEAGLGVLAECLEVIGSSKECYYEAEVYRLKGDGLLIQGGARQMVEEAEANLLRALDIARRQQAKSLELRAAVSLSRLWQKQDRRAEARNLLAGIYDWFTEGGIYDWFTEGFDTADLKDARDLLDSLA
jgi:predicted ATPase